MLQKLRHMKHGYLKRKLSHHPSPLLLLLLIPSSSPPPHPIIISSSSPCPPLLFLILLLLSSSSSSPSQSPPPPFECCSIYQHKLVCQYVLDPCWPARTGMVLVSKIENHDSVNMQPCKHHNMYHGAELQNYYKNLVIVCATALMAHITTV